MHLVISTLYCMFTLFGLSFTINTTGYLFLFLIPLISSHLLLYPSMALFKLLVASLLVSLLLLHLVDAHQQGYEAETLQGSLKQIDCNGACSARCRLSSRPRLCKRACGSCCKSCNCVPPGTAGNHDVCPCYASLTTHGGKPKCP